MALARKAYDPLVRAVVYGKDNSKLLGQRGITESAQALENEVAAVRRGDLSGLERALVCQANTLDTVFNDMLRRAALNAGQYLEATEAYMRMALRAQNQCRATLETLASIKNPPLVIAKQANVTTGPQQVNNCVPGPARAHAGENFEINNQPLEPSSGSKPSPPLLSQEQALRVPLSSASREGVERVPVPRCKRGSAKRRG